MYKNTNNFVRLLFIIDKESPNNTRAHIILYCVVCTVKTKSDNDFIAINFQVYNTYIINAFNYNFLNIAKFSDYLHEFIRSYDIKN